jgi:glycosyltransferase involved in cell wall biosynthesis
VRVLIDFRAALKSRSGVGEYAHQLASALARRKQTQQPDDRVDVTLFSSSWKDRLTLPSDLADTPHVDLRVPVSMLNLTWHRLGWPSAERLTGRTFDVTHSLHPLLLPARSAARVVTIHDLNFLAHPERTRAEIRRDYPALAPIHAHRADHVIVPSEFTAAEVRRRLGVPTNRISVCSPGAPAWKARESQPPNGYLLFLGTLEPRKNVGTLLDAYERLLTAPAPAPGRGPAVLPDLVLAGSSTPESHPWLARIAQPPLAGHVRHVGYIDPAERQRVYEGACLLVQPSFEEGFGIPVLEAMTLGVPVVAANRGALPEVLGDAGLLVDAVDAADMARAIASVLDDGAVASRLADLGPRRARQFQWDTTAERVVTAYRLAIEHRQCASA